MLYSRLPAQFVSLLLYAQAIKGETTGLATALHRKASLMPNSCAAKQVFVQGLFVLWLSVLVVLRIPYQSAKSHIFAGQKPVAESRVEIFGEYVPVPYNAINDGQLPGDGVDSLYAVRSEHDLASRERLIIRSDWARSSPYLLRVVKTWDLGQLVGFNKHEPCSHFDYPCWTAANVVALDLNVDVCLATANGPIHSRRWPEVGKHPCPFAVDNGIGAFLGSVRSNSGGRGLLFQVGQGSESNPDGISGHDYQEPIRPKRVSPRWQLTFLRRVLGIPLLLVSGWLRWNNRRRTVSLIMFILGWCLLLGPSLPERDAQQDNNQDVSVMHGR